MQGDELLKFVKPIRLLITMQVGIFKIKITV